MCVFRTGLHFGKVHPIEGTCERDTRASSKLHPADSDVFQEDTSSTNGWWTCRKRRRRVAPDTFPSSLSYFQLPARTDILLTSQVPPSSRTFSAAWKGPDRPPPPPLPSRCRFVPTSGFSVHTLWSTGETQQRCPATGAPPSASCHTRRWSTQWQVQWWAKTQLCNAKDVSVLLLRAPLPPPCLDTPFLCLPYS